MRQILVTDYSLQTHRVFTQDWLHTRLTQSPALTCLLYDNVNRLEGVHSWLFLLEISIIVNIVVYVFYCSVVGIFLFTCLPFCYAGVHVIWSSTVICLFTWIVLFLFIILILSDVKAKHQYLDSCIFITISNERVDTI